ncbi:DUF1203 domain-containing protein [Pseudoalteromonas xiamenensis]|uniref:DUF1203 domain-containing protein n=1 Tax=Pseudoalteromonas xiamenensis TaxID=882626 RepID=A0A975DNF2_9GAMM|nr:DUF1203 domain-containing protein [Pseudoalteromonas xiamenensis]QTH73611.1 DUF1203 domain-containing protein [Pseudoalteromonas xiamenensis]
MSVNFRIKSLPSEEFLPLMQMTDRELSLLDAKWIDVEEEPGYPCRVTLSDAKKGERVLFLPYWHHNVKSPYKAMGTILVREGAESTHFEVNQIPSMLQSRLLSVRAYNTKNIMVNHSVTEGTQLSEEIQKQLGQTDASYLQLHFAGPGCFCCTVERA